MPVKRRSTASSSKAVVQEEEQQEEDVVEDEDDDSEDGSDSDESEEVEMLATSRERRGNAGAKMAQLLEKEDPDEFYQSTYGGFFDEGVDNDYQSPTQSDSDDADSDFDKPESDDEPISDTEDAAGATKRRKSAHVGVYKEPKLRPSTTVAPKPQRTKREPRKEDLTPTITEKKFRWSTLQKSAMSGEARKKIKARFLVQGGPGSHQHKEYTQEELLAEAKITEQMNTKSLEKYQQYELEQKRKRDRAMKRRVIDGPKIRTLSVSMPVPPADIRPGEPALCSRTFMEFPDEHSLQKHFGAVAVTRPAKVRRGDSRCCVTGQPAKYRDPVTGLPYATIDALKQLRQRYETWVLEKADVSDPAVAAWVSWRQSATASS